MIKLNQMLSAKSLFHRLNRRDLPLFSPLFKTYFKIALLFVLISGSFFFVRSLLAADTSSTETSTSFMEKKQTQSATPNTTSWTKEITGDILFSGNNVLIGDIPESVFNGTYTGYIPQGFMGTINNAIAYTFTPAASGTLYLASLKDNFLGTKTAYAQGYGFTALQPLLPLWKGFRNIVYILSSLVLVVIGLMIILRVKINPQTVVSIQNALPRLVTTLILVTFSYAIAGLLIDLMQIFQGIVISLLFQMKGVSLTNNLFDKNILKPATALTSSNFSTLATSGFGTLTNLMSNLAPTVAIVALGGVLGTVIGGIIGGSLSGGALTVVGGALGFGAGSALFLFILCIAIVLWCLKLFVGLVKNYITIIFKIIIGPLEIGMGAFPGSKMGFSSWITDLIANLLVFPIVIIFMTLAYIIVEYTTTSGLWTPSVLSMSTLTIPSAVLHITDLFGGIIPIAIGVSALSIAAQLPTLVPQAIFMLKPSAWENAIGQGIKEAPTSFMGALGLLHTFSGARDDISRIIPKRPTPPAPAPVYVVPGPSGRTPTTSSTPAAGTPTPTNPTGTI